MKSRTYPNNCAPLDCANVFDLVEWRGMLACGAIHPFYDGTGYWMANGLQIAPVTEPQPTNATHVAWYNK